MQLPARIGKYELEEFLGGGMSHVYRAKDTVIGRTVAVKILTEAGCEDPEAKTRFLAEARMAGNISHDNVLSIYDFGEDDQHRPFMVMEYLRGEDLRHAIKNGHTGDLRAKLKIALQVGRALGYVHTQKIIHRDIKPENIHLSPTGVVKLMDFGIAKTEGLAMTRVGYVLGTPYYMAPEQVTGQGVTEQVDVYSFGVLLYELLTGNKPMAGETVERIFYSILNETLDLEPLVKAGVPRSVCDLVSRCTLKNQTQRPHGFAPICAEIESILTGLDAPTIVVPVVHPPPPPPPPKSSKAVWLLPLMLLVVAGLGLGLYLATRSNGEAPPGAQLPPVIQAKSGAMLLVEAGNFLSGQNPQPVMVPAFYIDQTEVTNQAYRAFCDATQRPYPADFPTDKPDFPVVNLSIQDADEFAKWAGERLPNAREWEKAARGTDGQLFPWGQQRDSSRANVLPSNAGDALDVLGAGFLRPVHDFEKGKSPFGAFQMVGNAWEMVFELTTPSENARAYFANRLDPPLMPDELWYQMRGGSYMEPLVDGALWDQSPIPGRFKNPNIGFRCVKDP